MKFIEMYFKHLAFLLICVTVKAQDPPPTIELKCNNIIQVSHSSFQFDVLIRRTSTIPYDYVYGQYAFSYNTGIRPDSIGGTWTLIVIASDLPAEKQNVINQTSAAVNGIFELKVPSPNVDQYLIPDTNDVLVAKVQATLSVPLVSSAINLIWKTDLPNPITKLYYNDHSAPIVRIPADNLTFKVNNKLSQEENPLKN